MSAGVVRVGCFVFCMFDHLPSRVLLSSKCSCVLANMRSGLKALRVSRVGVGGWSFAVRGSFSFAVGLILHAGRGSAGSDITIVAGVTP